MQASLPENLKAYSKEIKTFKDKIKIRSLNPISMYAFEERNAISFWIVIKKEQFRDRLDYAEAFFERI